MLVLSRRQQEKILLPDLGIVVEVLRVKGNQVRIGISAPASVKILRGELATEDKNFRANIEVLSGLRDGTFEVNSTTDC